MWEATTGPLAYEYCKVSFTEIETMDKIVACDMIDRTDGMNVIYYAIYFKLKHFPEVLLKTQGLFFCSRGSTF